MFGSLSFEKSFGREAFFVFRIKIADVVVEIDNIYSHVQDYCREWLTDETPDLRIKVGASELDSYVKNCGYDVIPAQAERILMCRKLAQGMIRHGGFLLHGAVVELDGCGIIFSGKRGIGKTTHVSLWREVFGERMRIINGDKPIIMHRDGRFIAHGTPWRGKENLGDRSSVEVKKLCFIKRGDTPSVRKICTKEAWTRMSRQTVYPDTPDLYEAFAREVALFLKSVDVYVITVSRKRESAVVVKQGILN